MAQETVTLTTWFWFWGLTTAWAQSSYLPPQLISPAILSATPGSGNTTATNMNPPIPPVWLNEAQPENVTGITNSLGTHEPWLEVYNSGTNALTLDGYYLANNYTN